MDKVLVIFENDDAAEEQNLSLVTKKLVEDKTLLSRFRFYMKTYD